MKSAVLRCSALLALVFPVVAHSQEAVTYGYDVYGRLISVSHSGGPANGVTSTYQYDSADNRTAVTVNGSPNGTEGQQYSAAVKRSGGVVVPLNGYTVIVLR